MTTTMKKTFFFWQLERKKQKINVILMTYSSEDGSNMSTSTLLMFKTWT